MKLELKNIKHTAWASHETHCYQASLYVEGKPVAVVGNDGQGGCDYEYDHPKCKADYRATMKAVHDYFKSLPKTDACDIFPEGMGQCLEFWCADQVNNFLVSRELKKKLKSHVLFQRQGEEGLFVTKYNHPVTDGDWVKDPRSAQYGRRVLNDMPFADALVIWKGTAQ